MADRDDRSGPGFWMAGLFGALLLRSLRSTWRVRQVPQRAVLTRREARSGEPGTIYVHWHSRILLSASTQAGTGLAVMISASRDGEYIARTIRRLGMETIRGSTSRGAARALIELIRTLREGRDAAITPDGPRGPRLVVQPGCVAAASRSGAPIVPVAFECARARRLRSWDRFVVPSPFTRVEVRFGEPVVVPPDLDPEGIEHWRRVVEQGLDRVTREAAEALGVAAETRDVDPLGGC